MRNDPGMLPDPRHSARPHDGVPSIPHDRSYEANPYGGAAIGSSPYGSPYYGDEGDGFDIRDILNMLRRRWKMIAGVGVLGMVVAAMAGMQMTPQYTATSTIMIDSRQSNVVDVQAVLSGLGTDATTVDTQIKMIRSPDNVANVVDALRLQQDSEFNPTLQEEFQREVDVVLEDPWRSFVNWMPDNWLIATGLAEERPLALDADTTSLIADDMTERNVDDRLQVSQDGRSLVLNISFTSDNPEKAAHIANKFAELFVLSSVDTKQEATGRASDWLLSRVESLKIQLEEAEAEIEQFRADNDLQDINQNSLNELELINLNAELAAARSAVAERNARVRLIEELLSRNESLETVPEVMSSPLFVELWRQETELERLETELKSSFGERHPRIQAIIVDKQQLRAKMGTEVDRIIVNLRNDAQIAQSRVDALEAEIDRIKAESSASRQAAMPIHELERQATAVRNLYENFLTRYYETREQEQIIESDARILGLAKVPTGPSSPGPALFAAVGLTASTMIGVLLALLLERLDTGIRSAKQIEQYFGLPCLGYIPFVKIKRGQKLHEYLLEKPLSTYAEAIRSIHTSLRLSNVDQPPQVIQITSSVPNEGKTTLSTSLASSLQGSGAKTLLMDLDLRHPSVQREIAEARQGGLVDYLTDTLSLEDLILHDDATGLDIVSINRTPSNPTTLLSSQRMKRLMTELRTRYDWIVVDSPPYLGVSDSRVITEFADTLLLVVQWEKTGRDTLEDSTKMIMGQNCPVAGAVITQVNVERHAKYGYGGVDKYYAKYRSYYVN